MKKTLMAMVMAGSCLTMFAQTTPPRTTTTSQSTTNNSVTNSTTDPLNSVTNTQVNTTTNNSVNASTSWAPVGSPNWGWNNYGIWNQRTNLNTTTYPSSYRTDASTYNSTSVPQGTTNMGTITTGTSNTYNSAAGSNSTTPPSTTNSTMSSGGGLSSTGAYDAYSTPQEKYGTPITSAPMNVQSNFGKEYPTTTSQTYTWNQYGDWYQTQYIDKGRMTQYYYDQKGAGYSLSLPVLQTYVPEEIVDKALQKYGSGLYSISMIKTADGTPAYSIGLIQRGELQMVHLKDDGSSVSSIWRVEEPVTDGMMNATDTNAAMDTQSSTVTDATIADDSNMKKEEKATKKDKWDNKKMKNKQKKVDE